MANLGNIMWICGEVPKAILMHYPDKFIVCNKIANHKRGHKWSIACKGLLTTYDESDINYIKNSISSYRKHSKSVNAVELQMINYGLDAYYNQFSLLEKMCV